VKIEKVLLVHKKSIYQLYVNEHKNKGVRQAIARGDRAAQRMQRSHQAQEAALARSVNALTKLGIQVTVRWRAHMRASRDYDLVVGFGGDGTVLDTSHRVLDDTPLLGINSDPKTSVGALCAGAASDLPRLIADLSHDKLRPQSITRLRVQVEGQDVLGPCLNDVLYAHASPAELSRFDMGLISTEDATRFAKRRRSGLDMHRCSGLWVSTATGSTAAVRSAGGKIMPSLSRRLQYLVREPYYPPGEERPKGIVGGFIDGEHALAIVSRVRRGMIWADGPHRRMSVAYGQRVVVDAHPQPLRLIRRAYR